jgi:hypothetical protein
MLLHPTTVVVSNFTSPQDQEDIQRPSHIVAYPQAITQCTVTQLYRTHVFLPHLQGPQLHILEDGHFVLLDRKQRCIQKLQCVSLC